MFKTIFILTLICLATSQVISRNERLSQMSDRMKQSLIELDTLIESADKKMTEDLEFCVATAKNSNCSNLNVWEHQRKKHSKNITNMQNKIQKHQETIEKIMSLNQKETQKKQLTINAIIPKIRQLKDTVEYIQNIEWLIKDTYINIEDQQQSLLHLFDIKSHQQIQSILTELMSRKKEFHDPGAHPSQQDYLPEHPEKPPKPEQQFNQGPPLIDEDIFDGHNEQYGESVVPQLFEDEVEEKVVQADIIPDGVDVPEHDEQAKEIDEIIEKYVKDNEKQQEDEEDTDLDLEFGEESFKKNVKNIGQKLFLRLQKLRQEVEKEKESLVQGVADLEKAIYNLHHKHASQIVQIYMATKQLQREIFEKDDIVLALDARVHECKNMNEILKECEENKILDGVFIQNLEAQKAINQGIVKELQKLMLYSDKMVQAPQVKPEELKIQAEEVVNEIEREKQQEIEEIEQAEKEVEAEAEQQAPIVEPVVEEQAPVVQEQVPPPEQQVPVTEEQVPVVEEQAPVVEEQAPVVEETPATEEPPITQEGEIPQPEATEQPPAETPAMLAKHLRAKNEKKQHKNQ